jgi:transcriptional regulator with XRE-family HTH domain
MNIQKLITKKREDLGLTQGQLAELIGVKPAMVSHLENGRRSLSPARAKAIEKALGIPREKLLPEVFA